MLAIVVGCGQRNEAPPEIAAQQTSYRAPTPEEFLAAIFRRYRNASSYRDRAVVRLTYRNGEREESKLAPLHVWLSHDRLYVEAYDVRLRSDPSELIAWITDPSTDHFESQVLRLPGLQHRPTLPTLLADPIVASRISAGLAGPPPQLDWLFSREPMKQLFHNQHRFDFGLSRSIDGRLCRSIDVTADDQKFVFWIDSSAGLIRRVDLPPIMATSSDGTSTQSMELRLEFLEASFDSPGSHPELPSFPESPIYVRQFVAPPTPQTPSAQNTIAPK